VAWQKAESLLADFRKLMEDAGLLASDVDGQLIAVREADPDTPVFIEITDRAEALRILSAPDIIPIGCIFRQHDAVAKQNVDFFVQFTGLSEQGMNVLTKAAEMQHTLSQRTSARGLDS
jgi:hypothetical protein